MFVAAVPFTANKAYNLAVYWGQDSAGQQQRLSFYCQDDTIDIIPLAFLPTFFDEGGLPSVDFSNICSSDNNAFPGTNLANCAYMASDIQQCQAKGKILLLSLGGAVAQVGFSDDSQAEWFADTIWNLFLGGSSGTRPFGNAVLDGIDLDIEQGSPTHYPAFVQRIRSLASGTQKQYYVSAAPQCPFPDQHIGDALNQAHFDFVFVQFYNNYCQVSDPSQFNFNTWDHWARYASPNPNVKVFLGAPGSPGAAGQGYVDIATLSGIATDMQNKYPSFGGVMLWDADSAYQNDQYHVAIKNAIRANVPVHPAPSVTPASTPKPSATPPSTPINVAASPQDPRTFGRVRPLQLQHTSAKKDIMPQEKRRLSRFFRL
ncbi:glycoside hydrolase family 18 protein [Amanita muscaria Koide BX008]|uniref:chitinase n=1 Tax=Amanita muscaria (strain Koide BX008) TaxID=946122 RepID=A0A0C2X9H9_AMAMK|nr:glycoside hydrolase family 18 protein [Amanita muscaria Koide BX008]